MASTQQARVLVTGASGRVGGQVTALLARRGVPVRVATREPGSFPSSPGVEVAAVDLGDPTSLEPTLEGVDSAYLMWPFFDDPETTRAKVGPLAEMLGERVRRVVYLSSETVEHEPGSLWGVVEDGVREHVAEWTMLRPTGFARNAEQWAEQIRGGGAVRWPFGEMARPVVHETDMAEVAVEALLRDDLVGRSVVLTGPELISQREQVDAIGAAIGRTVPWVEIGRDEAERELDLPRFMLDAWEEMLTSPEPVTDGVSRVLGRPATPFARWAESNAALFRP